VSIEAKEMSGESFYGHEDKDKEPKEDER